MMTIRAYAALSLGLGISILLSGCARLGAAARIDPVHVADYRDYNGCITGGGTTDTKSNSGHGIGKSGSINLDCFRFPEQTSLQTAYKSAVLNKEFRNRLAAILIKQSDDQCTTDNARVVANESLTNASLNILLTGLTAAATIVTGQKADSILTGTAALVSGSRDHINASVYRNQVTQAITASISGERKRLKDLIETRRPDDHIAYQVDEMIRDVNEYHQACSFYKGLETLLTSARDYPKLTAIVDRASAGDRLVDVNKLIAAHAGITPTATEKTAYDAYAKTLADQRSALTLVMLGGNTP